jgi:hypothetical protein
VDLASSTAQRCCVEPGVSLSPDEGSAFGVAKRYLGSVGFHYPLQSELYFCGRRLDECHHSAVEQKNRRDDTREDFLRRLKNALIDTTSRVLVVSRDAGDIRSQLCAEICAITETTMYELAISKDDVQDDVMRYSKHIVSEKLPKKKTTLCKTVFQ